jgi:predicted TPR repeat methyltransferase
MRILTKHPIAMDSADYLDPYGSMHNSSTNSLFNQHLYSLFDHKISILDLGCAGGGFVEQCNKDEHYAVGIDGSDYPKKNNLHAWSRIPDKLFTADITKVFNIMENNNFAYFDVITAWELLEHIPEKDINSFVFNVKCHLKHNGLFIVSINVASQAHAQSIYNTGWGITNKFHHRNIKCPKWWDKKLLEFGLIDDINIRSGFQGQFIRGPGFGCCPIHTEERYNQATEIKEQWATINRVCILR